jgi:hypothetical protein
MMNKPIRLKLGVYHSDAVALTPHSCVDPMASGRQDVIELKRHGRPMAIVVKVMK